jgi:hypothetical protein
MSLYVSCLWAKDKFQRVTQHRKFIAYLGAGDLQTTLLPQPAVNLIVHKYFISIFNQLLVHYIHLDKTCCMKFSAKEDFINKLNIEYGNKNVIELNVGLGMVNSLDGLCQYNKLFYNFYILKFIMTTTWFLTAFTFNITYTLCLLHFECCIGLLSISWSLQFVMDFWDVKSKKNIYILY